MLCFACRRRWRGTREASGRSRLTQVDNSWLRQESTGSFAFGIWRRVTRQRVLRGHRELVRHLEFSTDAEQLLSASHDGSVACGVSKTAIASCTFAIRVRDASLLCTRRSHRYRVRRWHPACLGRSHGCGEVDFTWTRRLDLGLLPIPKRRTTFSISEDGTMKRWRWSETQRLGVPETEDWFAALGMDRQGELVVGVTNLNQLRVWQAGQPVAVRPVTVQGPFDIDISSDQQVVCGQAARLLGPGKWQAAEKLVGDSTNCVSIDSAGKRVATSDGFRSCRFGNRIIASSSLERSRTNCGDRTKSRWQTAGRHHTSGPSR